MQCISLLCDLTMANYSYFLFDDIDNEDTYSHNDHNSNG